MAGLSREALADGAGVEIGDVDRLVELGILRAGADGTFRDGDVRRIRVVDSLVEGGLALEGLAEAFRRDTLSLDFVDQESYGRIAAFSPTTFHELSAQSGVPFEVLTVMREAMGFAAPAADDPVRESELLVVPYLRVQLAAGVRPTVIERSLRTTGEALRRIAESEAEWWRSDILGPLFAQGLPPAEIGRRTGALADASAVHGDAALLALYHGLQANAWLKNIFEGFEIVLEREGLHARVDRPPAICFLDLTGYTRLTEEHGDAAAAELAARLARLVQRRSGEHGGRPVKWLGDGVMFYFPDPGPGVVAALDMLDDTREAGLPPAHIGLHAGPVLRQEGDYFGRTVNVAARIADYARQGEVLVSHEIVEASSGSGVRFTEIGPVELKGLSGAMRLYSAQRAVPASDP